MYSLIITDYKSILQSLLYIERFCRSCVESVDCIIIDNSAEHHGKKYLLDNKIQFSSKQFEKNIVYSFIWKQNKIAMIDTGENGGYSKGNNIGAIYSDKVYDNPYYIFSNNDIEFYNIIKLEKFKLIFDENNQIGIIGPCVILPDGKRQNPRKSMGFVSQMILEPYNLLWFGCRFNKWLWNLGEDVPGKTGWVSGSFMVVKRKAFQEVGRFDEKIFLYAEEMILSERMRRKGYQTVYEPSVTVIHHHRGMNSNYFSRKRNHISKKYYYGSYKNVHKSALFISDINFEFSEFVYSFWKLIKTVLTKVITKDGSD